MAMNDENFKGKIRTPIDEAEDDQKTYNSQVNEIEDKRERGLSMGRSEGQSSVVKQIYAGNEHDAGM